MAPSRQAATQTSAPIWLSSARNPLVQRFRRALARGELTPDGCCAIEGLHLVEEALASPVEVVALVGARSAEAKLAHLERQVHSPSPSSPPGWGRGHEVRGRSQVRSYLVPDRVFRSLADTQTPQGIAALVRLRPFKLEEILHEERALIMVLVGLQDPGNLGTIVRSLEAFGGGACLLTANTVSPFNPKAVRASAGSLFRVPVFRQLSPERILALCREYGLRTIGLMPRAGQSLAELNLRQPVALFVGQEASGLTSQVATQLDETARIPVAQPVESLNTGTAASVALYEAARQRGYGKEFHGTV